MDYKEYQSNKYHHINIYDLDISTINPRNKMGAKYWVFCDMWHTEK